MNKDKIETIAATAAIVVITANAVYGLYSAAKLVRKPKNKKTAEKEN
jgi:hypothetical protein